MGIYHNAIYGFGFIVTKEEVEKHNEITDSEFFYTIDGYGDEEDTPYFFGIVINYLDPGEYCQILPVDTFKPGELKRMIDEFKGYNCSSYEGPRHYMFCGVT